MANVAGLESRASATTEVDRVTPFHVAGRDAAVPLLDLPSENETQAVTVDSLLWAVMAQGWLKRPALVCGKAAQHVRASVRWWHSSKDSTNHPSA